MSEDFVYVVNIKEHHVDSLGHMNNSTYLALYEEARWELITQNGYGFKEVQKLQKGPVILDLHLKFMKEIHLRETIRILTKLVSYESKVGQMFQQMVKSDGSIASEVSMNFGLFDMQSRKLIAPTPEWKMAIGL